MEAQPIAQHSAARRRSLVCAAAVLAAVALAPAARAGDLIVLQGDVPAVLSGTASYDHVYIDGTLRLAGDTTINANDVYISSQANVQTCYVDAPQPDGGDNKCVDGRSLAINSTGRLTIGSAIDLTGGTVTPQRGGSLSLNGNAISIGGDINTTGDGAASGSVTIMATGAIEAQNITAPSQGITLHAGGAITVAGDLRTTPAANTPDNPGKAPSGGGVDVVSAKGDIAIGGSISAGGADVNVAGGTEGGDGGQVNLDGGDVRVGNVDAGGGHGTDFNGGAPGPIRMAARGSLTALGTVDSSGGTSTQSAGTNGASINLAAGGQVTASQITVAGASGITGDGTGGTVKVTAGSVVAGTIYAWGGSGTSSSNPLGGSAGGAVSVVAQGNISLGTVYVGGGDAQSYGGGGAGGGFDATGDRISLDSVWADGGRSGGAGANGGHISVQAESALVAAGTLVTSASDAGGTSDPAPGGGVGGPISLSAPAGVLDLGGALAANGGRGAQGAAAGGPGGPGGAISLVAPTVESVPGIYTNGGAGGQYGDTEGAGGNGGNVTAWSESSILGGGSIVDTTGGDGNPPGLDGSQIQESAPTGLTIDTTGALSFSTHSPDADGFRVLASAAGSAPAVVLTTTATAHVVPPAPAICVPTTYTVVAFKNSVGWTSAATMPVSFTSQPSTTQTCVDPPLLTTASQKIRLKYKVFKKAHYRVTLHVVSTGMGSMKVIVRRGRKTLITVTKEIAKAGHVNVPLVLPKPAHRKSTYQIRITAFAPTGGKTTTSTVSLEVHT